METLRDGSDEDKYEAYNVLLSATQKVVIFSDLYNTSFSFHYVQSVRNIVTELKAFVMGHSITSFDDLN